jgi:hypothetical protein
MSEQNGYGMSRSEMEYELRWLLRKAPKDAAKLPQFIGEVVITLIEKNNEALARASAEQDRPDLPDSF